MRGYTSPDLSSMALLTIDVQNNFISGSSPGKEEKIAVLPKISLVAETFRKMKKPVVHIVRIYKRDGSNADLCRKEDIQAGSGLLSPGSQGVQVAEDILPSRKIRLDEGLLLKGGIQELSSHEFIIYKPRFGAFYKTALSSLLEKLDVNTLVFSGFNFPNCPRASIYEASERDYRIIALKDGISQIYPRGQEELENIGVVIMTAQELARNMRGVN